MAVASYVFPSAQSSGLLLLTHKLLLSESMLSHLFPLGFPVQSELLEQLEQRFELEQISPVLQ